MTTTDPSRYVTDEMVLRATQAIAADFFAANGEPERNGMRAALEAVAGDIAAIRTREITTVLRAFGHSDLAEDLEAAL